MNNKYYFVILLFSLITVKIKSQISQGGMPYTSMVNTTSDSLSSFVILNPIIPSINLPAYSNADLQRQGDSLSKSCLECRNKYFGMAIEQTLDLLAQGTYQLIDNIKVYRLKVHSDNAQALQFYFSKFKIPENGALYFYNSNKTKFYGAMRSNNNSIDSLQSEDSQIVMSTSPLLGNEWIMEYNENVNSNFNTQIVINKIVHVYDNKAFSRIAEGDNECQIDVACDIGNIIIDCEKKSTVLITFLSNPTNTSHQWLGLCTGNLINTTSTVQTLYVLSAGHCFRETNDGAFIDRNSLQFVYKYERDNCYFDGSSEPFNLSYVSHGATILKCRNKPDLYDYALLRLDKISNQTLNQWDVCYAGWNKNSTGNAFDAPYVLIHHALAREKKFAVTWDEAMSSVKHLVDPIPNPNPNPKNFYKARWAQGIALQVSDGASLFDKEHRIVGTYCGDQPDDPNAPPNTYATCNNGIYSGGYDRFSKFQESYIDNENPDGPNDLSIDFFLNPDNLEDPQVDCNCPTVEPVVTGGEDGSGASTDFSINGATNVNGIINICSNDVTLFPTGPKWLFSESSAGYGLFPTLCSNINNVAMAAKKTQSNTIFGNFCKAAFTQFLLSVQECNNNLTPIGQEYVQWFYFYDGDIFNYDEINYTGPINLATYPPQGYSLQDGKYYKIKYGATYNYTYWESSLFIKTLPQTLILQYENIIHKELAADWIYISNSTAPITSPAIKVVAGNTIQVSQGTKLQSGRYYISPVNCGNAPFYRPTQNSNNSSQSITNANSKIFAKDLKSNQITKLREDKIMIYPNPTNGNINFEFLTQQTNNLVLSIENVTGQQLLTQSFKGEEGKTANQINLNNLTNGIYIVKVTNAQGNLVKTQKIILSR